MTKKFIGIQSNTPRECGVALQMSPRYMDVHGISWSPGILELTLKFKPSLHNCLSNILSNVFSYWFNHGDLKVYATSFRSHVSHPFHQYMSIFKHQLGCRFDILDSISSFFFCILTYVIIYVLIHHIIFWLYLYFLNILYFFKYSCTNIFHRRSIYTFYLNTFYAITLQWWCCTPRLSRLQYFSWSMRL